MSREKIITVNTFKKSTSVHFTHHSDGGKLAGMMSISTSCLCNARCCARMQSADENNICKHCFSAALQAQYTNLESCMRKNAEILTASVIPVNEWPMIADGIFRLESFGDVANVTQVLNYFNFCRRNPHTTFTVWTKNPDIYAQALETAKKPKNLIIILSACIIGLPVDASRFPFVDKTFTVFHSEEEAAAAGRKINCGFRKCLACRACYSKRGPKEINELLK